jgi:hypothetical protein
MAVMTARPPLAALATLAALAFAFTLAAKGRESDAGYFSHVPIIPEGDL